MKITMDVEIDWIDDESNIDDEIKRQLIKGVATAVEEKFCDKAKSQVAQAAERLISAKVDQLIYGLLEKPVVVSDGWNNQREYESVYDMVETRMTELYHGKFDNSSKCEKDPLLGKIEKYVDQQLSNKFNGIERMITSHAKKHATDALKESSLIKSLQAVIPEVSQAVVN
jgi:tRNA(Ile)-lysidine synthase TilS/MesJ